MREADKLVQSAIKRLEAAEALLGELSPVAYALVPGVEIWPEPDDAARRAERRNAEAARGKALRDLKELVQVLHPQKE